MNDERWKERIQGALLRAVTLAGQRSDYNTNGTDAADEQWRMIAAEFVNVIEVGDRPMIEEHLEATRTPGFLEVNDEIWKATGKVITLHVNTATRIIERVSLQPQPDREVSEMQEEFVRCGCSTCCAAYNAEQQKR